MSDRPDSRFRREARHILRYALPLMVGSVAIMGMAMTDVLVAGRAGTHDLAAVSLAAAIWNLCLMLSMGTVFGNAALIGRLHGARDPKRLRQQFRQTLWLLIPLSVIAVGLQALGYLYMPRLAPDPSTTEIARNYLAPMMVATPVVLLVTALRTTLEGIGDTRPVMTLSVLLFLLNIPLDFLLVLGFGPIPGMGGAGCGWASLIVTSLSALLFGLHIGRGKVTRPLRLWRGHVPPAAARLRETLRVGLPLGAAILAEGGFFFVIPMLIASLGAVVLGGHSVAMYFDMLMFMIPLGISQALTIRVSHHLGGRDAVEASYSARTGLWIVVAAGLLQVAFIVAFRHQIAGLFSNDPAVIDLAATLLLLAAAYRLFDSLQVGAAGILRAYRDTRFIMIMGLLAYWIVGFPLCWVLAFTDWIVEPMGVYGFWVGTICTLSLTSSSILWRVFVIARREVRRQPPPANALRQP